MLLIVVPLAILAALGYALSDFLEQRAAVRAADNGDSDDGESGFVWRQFGSKLQAFGRKLVHDRQWLAGWGVGTLAYVVQAVALRLGSVAVVQSLQVTTLLFALPLSTVGRSERPGVRDWLSGASACAGLGLLLGVRGNTGGSSEVHRGRLLFLLAILGGAVVWLFLAAMARRGPSRAVFLAVAAGAAFAANATLVKVTFVELTTRGVLATALDWTGYALAVASVLGVVLQQMAFASGRLPTATTGMVVANPLVGAAIGVVAFSERLPHSAVSLVLIGLAGLLIVLGVLGLAHSPLLLESPSLPGPPESPRERRRTHRRRSESGAQAVCR